MKCLLNKVSACTVAIVTNIDPCFTIAGNNASIQIDLNPVNARHLPECRFLGADNGIIIYI